MSEILNSIYSALGKFFTVLDSGIVTYNEYVGGYLLLIFLVPTGIFFAIYLKFLHVRKLPHSLAVIGGKYDKKDDTGDINHFRALTTALSATVGTGNIVGVALALYWGGPGAIFWMWVTGFLGMILKYAECTLSFKFRKINEDGSMSGGPMYYMEHGLKDKLGPTLAKIMAVVFAVAAIFCSMGTGNMAQSNSMSDLLKTNYNIPTFASGLVITALVLLVIVGGIKRIAEVTSKLVPFMAAMYFIGCIAIIIVYAGRVPAALNMIVTDAFTGTAMTGGFAGSIFIMTLVWGVRRGLFSNEAGQGSAAIAHAAAKTEYPVREGLVASVGPFIDTLIICTMTALVIILTGAWTIGVEGVGMTVEGFTRGFAKIGLVGWGKHVVAGGLLLFAFSTIISWSYYGTRAAQYLMGSKSIKPYRYVYGFFVFLGALGKIDFVWHFVDMVITWMTIPNLIAIVLLSPIIKKETIKYLATMKKLKKLQ